MTRFPRRALLQSLRVPVRAVFEDHLARACCSPPAPARVLLTPRPLWYPSTSLMLASFFPGSLESLRMWRPSSWCPASSKSPEGGDRCPGRGFSRQGEIVPCHKQLPIGIQHVGKGNRAGFISFLRAVPNALQSRDLDEDFVASQFRLGQLAERVLYVFCGPQDRVPVSQDCLGIGARTIL